MILKLIKKSKIETIECIGLQPIFIFTITSLFLIKKNIKCFFYFTGLGYLFTTNNYFYRIIRFFIINFFKIYFNIYKNHILIVENEKDFNLFRKLTSFEKVKKLNGVGVNLNKIHRLELKDNFDSKIKLVYAGRILIDKGLIELLEAFKILKSNFKKTHNFNYELYIIGSPDYKNPNYINFDDLKKIYNKNIYFMDHKPNILEILNNMHIFILPSYREGFPKSLSEASCLGLGIVTTNVPGCSDLVKMINYGRLAKPKNSIDLYKKIIDCTNEDLKFPRNTRKHIETSQSLFNEEIISNNHLRLLNCNSL